MRVFLALVLSLPLLAAPVWADGREAACAQQAKVVTAIQKARMGLVRKDNVVPRLMRKNPDWPAAMETAMPALVEWVYAQKRSDLRGVDLGETSRQQCLDNWELIQEIQQDVAN